MADEPLMTDEKYREVEVALRRVGALGDCPICVGARELIAGYTQIFLFRDPGTVDLRTGQGCGVASVLVGCTQCGNLTQHAVNQLGVAP
jgi:hypothetical protein